MSHDLQRAAIARSITARLPLASLGEIRLLDIVLETIEAIRHGDGRTWMRRVATGPGDVDTSYHLARPLRATVATACGGSWLIDDAVESSPNPPLEERCHACWRAAAARSPGGPALGETLLVLVAEMAERDRERAGLREAALDEMVPRAPVVTIGLPGDDLSDRVVVDDPGAGFAADRHLTVLSRDSEVIALGDERRRDEDLEVELEWDVSDEHAGSGT